MKNTQIQPKEDTLNSMPHDEDLGRKKHKKWLVSATVIIVLLILIGSVVVYLKLTSPERLLGQSLENTMKLQAMTFQVSSNISAAGSNPNTLKIDGQYNRAKGYTATLSTTTESSGYSLMINEDLALDAAGNGYTKYTKVTNALGTSAKLQMSETDLQIMQKSLGSTWVKVPASDKQSGFVCLGAALEKIQNDTANESAFAKALLDIVTVKVASSGGDTVTYSLKTNTNASRAAVDAYKATAFYKTISQCDETAALIMPSKADVEIKINKQTRQIKSVTINGGQDGALSTLQLTLTPAQNVTVTIPKM